MHRLVLASAHCLGTHSVCPVYMRLHSGIIVSRSEDKIIKMWDLQTGECLHVLRGHSKGLWCVHYDGRLLISGARDDKVKVWNPETEECLHTLVGHLNPVNRNTSTRVT